MINRTINKDSILHQTSSDIVTNNTNDLFCYLEEEYWGAQRAFDTIRSPKFKKFLSDRFNVQDLSSIADFIKCIGESFKTGQFPPDNDSFSLSEIYLKLVMNQGGQLINYLVRPDYQAHEAIESPEFKEFLSARFSTKDLANIAVFLKCIIENCKTGKFPKFPPDDDSFSLSEEDKVYHAINRLEVMQSLIEKAEAKSDKSKTLLEKVESKLRTIEDKLKTLEGYKFVFNDGGRSKYFKGQNVGDCVTRAIAIASDQDYKIIYDDLKALTKEYIKNHNNKSSRAMEKQGNRSVRWGTSKTVYHPYLLEQGWTWTPTNYIGQKHKVYLQVDDLPKGRLIVQIRKHLTVVEDGCLYDTWDCSYLKTPMVYGYYMKPQIGGEQ